MNTEIDKSRWVILAKTKQYILQDWAEWLFIVEAKPSFHRHYDSSEVFRWKLLRYILVALHYCW
jgi:hypothetical protein